MSRSVAVRSISVIFCALAILTSAVRAHAQAIEAFNPGATQTISAIAIQPDGKILVGGGFTGLGGVTGTTTRNRIGRLNVDGTVDSTFNPGANSLVQAIAVQPDGKILIGGNFTAVGGGTGLTHLRSRLARFNNDGSVDTSFDPGVNGTVYAIVVVPDGTILVGGEFSMIGGGGSGTTPRSRLARLGTNGVPDAFDPGVSKTGGGSAIVYTMALQPDGKIVVGGYFNGLGGGTGNTTRNYIGRLESNGAVDGGFNPGANSISGVNAVVVQPDGMIVIGGSFTGLGAGTGVTLRSNIGRVDTAGVVDISFNPGAESQVLTLGLQLDGKILAGGYFQWLGGGGGVPGRFTRKYIGRIHPSGAVDASYDPGSDNIVHAIAEQADGATIAAGTFTGLGGGIGGTPRLRIGRIATTDAAVQSLTLTNGGTVKTWLRGGGGPEVPYVTFEFSFDGSFYSFLGYGTRIAGGWQNTGVNLPTSINVWLRARGYYGTGTQNGSGSIVEYIAVSGPVPPPGAFSKSAPANGATGQATSPLLTWAPSSGATSYDLCLDTTADGACSGWFVVGNVTSYQYSAYLAPGRPYSWQVRANNDSGIPTYANGATTAFWGFTTATVSDFNGDGFADLIWHNAYSGENAVWYLNGTSVVGYDALPTVFDPTWQLVASADFNNDGHLDLVWRNTLSGDNAVWFMNGATVLGQASLPTVNDPTWQIVASADFNRDGHPDLVWRNLMIGWNVVWYFNGTAFLGQGNFPTLTDPTWQLVAAADIYVDGYPDLIWHNTLSGENVVWAFNNTTFLGQLSFPTVADPTWRLVAAFDVNQDTWTDLIWRNTLTGSTVVWYFSGTTFLGQGEVQPPVYDLPWQIIGANPREIAADFNGDRHPDLVWRNTSTGANLVWYLNGTTLGGQNSLTTVADQNWKIVARVDVNGDTHPDLIWRNSVTGDNLVWYLNGTALIGQAAITAVPDTNWRIVGAADFNNDTHPDLVWRNAVTGANLFWYLNGVTLLRQQSFTAVPDLTWQIVAVADFTGDARPDLVWRNTVSGANLVWTVYDSIVWGQINLVTVPDTAWQIVAAADINGDTRTDLVWRNTSTGANVVWYLNGTQLIGQASLPTVSDLNWSLRGGG